MTEIQQAAMQEVLKVFTNALRTGVDPDILMGRLIQRGIEVVRGKEHSGNESLEAPVGNGI
jgi:hypothetical protein